MKKYFCAFSVILTLSVFANEVKQKNRQPTSSRQDFKVIVSGIGKDEMKQKYYIAGNLVDAEKVSMEGESMRYRPTSMSTVLFYGVDKWCLELAEASISSKVPMLITLAKLPSLTELNVGNGDKYIKVFSEKENSIFSCSLGKQIWSFN